MRRATPSPPGPIPPGAGPTAPAPGTGTGAARAVAIATGTGSGTGTGTDTDTDTDTATDTATATADGDGDGRAARIFRYVVRIDRGGSPNPYHGWCSLAVCKPQIRRSARVGDWIVGLRSRANDQVIFAMRVDEVLALGDYWRDPRFRAKRPGRGRPPDNFYRAGRDGSLVRVANDLHAAELATQDIAGRHALLSWRFWYFGAASPELPTDLVHLVHSGQGHSLHVNRRADDLQQLRAWLAHWPPGIHGSPVDRMR